MKIWVLKYFKADLIRKNTNYSLLGTELNIMKQAQQTWAYLPYKSLKVVKWSETNFIIAGLEDKINTVARKTFLSKQVTVV